MCVGSACLAAGSARCPGHSWPPAVQPGAAAALVPLAHYRACYPHNAPVKVKHRRRINTEEKAQAVRRCWSGDVLECRTNHLAARMIWRKGWVEWLNGCFKKNWCSWGPNPLKYGCPPKNGLKKSFWCKIVSTVYLSFLELKEYIKLNCIKIMILHISETVFTFKTVLMVFSKRNLLNIALHCITYKN